MGVTVLSKSPSSSGGTTVSYTQFSCQNKITFQVKYLRNKDKLPYMLVILWHLHWQQMPVFLVMIWQINSTFVILSTVPIRKLPHNKNKVLTKVTHYKLHMKNVIAGLCIGFIGFYKWSCYSKHNIYSKDVQHQHHCQYLSLVIVRVFLIHLLLFINFTRSAPHTFSSSPACRQRSATMLDIWQH